MNRVGQVIELAQHFRRIREEKSRIKGLAPGRIGLKGLDQRGIGELFENLLDIVVFVREVRTRERKISLHGDLVEGLLVQKESGDFLLGQAIVKIWIECLTFFRDDLDIQVSAGKQHSLLALPGQFFANFNQRRDQTRPTLLEIRAMDLGRIAGLRSRLLEIRVDRDHGHADAAERAARGHAILSESQHDGWRLIKTREIHFYS